MKISSWLFIALSIAVIGSQPNGWVFCLFVMYMAYSASKRENNIDEGAE